MNIWFVFATHRYGLSEENSFVIYESYNIYDNWEGKYIRIICEKDRTQSSYRIFKFLHNQNKVADCPFSLLTANDSL